MGAYAGGSSSTTPARGTRRVRLVRGEGTRRVRLVREGGGGGHRSRPQRKGPTCTPGAARARGCQRAGARAGARRDGSASGLYRAGAGSASGLCRGAGPRRRRGRNLPVLEHLGRAVGELDHLEAVRLRPTGPPRDQDRPASVEPPDGVKVAGEFSRADAAADTPRAGSREVPVRPAAGAGRRGAAEGAGRVGRAGRLQTAETSSARCAPCRPGRPRATPAPTARRAARGGGGGGGVRTGPPRE